MGLILENSSTSLLFLHRNLISPLLLSADKSFISISQNSKILQLLRYLVVYIFCVVIQVLHSLPLPLLFRSESSTKESDFLAYNGVTSYDHKQQLVRSCSGSSGKHGLYDTAIARAMWQLLSLVNDVPVSSRKYEVVRSLAEKLIEENNKEGSEALRLVNCVVLSEAFGRALLQLEAALLDQENNVGFGPGLGLGEFGLGRVVRVVKGWSRVKGGCGLAGLNEASAEKMAAELLWLAQKLGASGGGEVAVEKWAWASKLGWLALSVEPRVQASLVKLTAFLIKQAKDMGKEQQTDADEAERLKQTKMKMLMTWIPLLCRASNGTDAPTLSISERGEIEGALEEIIDKLEENVSQEKVLSLWLHHFTQCPSSDWPNLHEAYIRWCTISRKLLLTQ